jgi:DNA-binding transcriptional ArsR family regulator
VRVIRSCPYDKHDHRIAQRERREIGRLDIVRPCQQHLDNDLNIPATREIRLLDRTIRALADPTRREILKVLRDGDLPAGEIAAMFPISGASVSHHLSVLKEADLVQSERDGRSIVYSLNSTVFQEFIEEMMGFFDIGGSE